MGIEYYLLELLRSKNGNAPLLVRDLRYLLERAKAKKESDEEKQRQEDIENTPLFSEDGE